MTPEDPSGVPPQRSGAATCSLRLELRAVILPGLSVPVAARLRYVRAEPYAVYLDTHVDMHAPITWVFARELLATGLHQWAGLGDVSVHPGTDGEADTVYICLGYEDEGVVLRAPPTRCGTSCGRPSAWSRSAWRASTSTWTRWPGGCWDPPRRISARPIPVRPDRELRARRVIGSAFGAVCRHAVTVADSCDSVRDSVRDSRRPTVWRGQATAEGSSSVMDHGQRATPPGAGAPS